MADLQFNEEQYMTPATAQKPSLIAGLVIRLGLAQDEAGAQKALVVVLVVVVIAIIAVNFFSGSSAAPPPPPSITGAPSAP